MARPLDTDQDLWVSWDRYHALIERLCVQLFQSRWQFDHVLCLARGGLRVGDVVSRVFKLPLAILATSSYRTAHGTQRDALNIAANITMTYDRLEGRVLIVDDLVDSGRTLEGVGRHLQQQYPQIIEIRTAVLWCKGCAPLKPDYFVEYLPTNPWIHQPFENYDRLAASDLASHASAGRTER